MHRLQPAALAALLFVGLGAGISLASGEALAQVQFKDAANVCMWAGRADAPAYQWLCTKPCSSNMSVIDDCYNADAPPAPSLFRPLEAAGIVPETAPGANTLPYLGYPGPVQGQGATLYPIDTATAFWPHGQKTPGMTAVLPTFRSSNDARLQLAVGDYEKPAFVIFRPEALDYDLSIKAAGPGSSTAISPSGPYRAFEPLMYQNPLATGLSYAAYAYKKNEGKYIHNTICDDSSPAWDAPNGRTRNPIACRASKTISEELSNSTVDGDCYQISVLFNGSQDYGSPDWEMRTVALTVFVPSAKRDGVNLAVDAQQPWIYPRQPLSTASGIPVLPAYDRFTVGMPWGGGMASGSAYIAAVQTACYSGTSPRPRWCEYLDNQKHRNTFTLHHANGTETWNGSGTYSLFEPSVTGDGRLLVLNLNGFGLAYSYNKVGSCDADGWSEFKHVSEMPWDPDVNTRYPIAMNMQGCGPETCGPARYFRDTKGRNIHWRDPIRGAYPWIDREGRNIFFSIINQARDGWKAKSQSNCAPTDACAKQAQFLNPDIDPGKGVVALGAWTQGKMVVLDNGLNFSDFGNHPDGTAPSRTSFQMALYQDDPATPANEANLTIRPKATRQMLSPENQLNYYEAMSPTLPFDVVWPFASDTEHDAEVAFDEYLRNDALVVAHMNAPVEIDPQGRPLYDDGFVPTNPGADVRYETNPGNRGGYYFKKTPRLQNAATADAFFDPNAVRPPSDLRLRGGARVEPMGIGGVLGKGVYLDGKNDMIDVGGIYTLNDDWYYGVWLDSREDDEYLRRIVFQFADQSYIEMSRKEIVTLDTRISGPDARKSFSIARLGLAKGKYFHLGVSITTEGNQRVLRFSINGTKLAYGEVRYNLPSANPYDWGFGIRLKDWGDWGWFLVGGIPKPNHPYASTNLLPWKGWVDELRTYRVTPQLAAGSYFDEFACNLALGTLVEVRATDKDMKHAGLRALYYTAFRSGLVSTAPWRVRPTPTECPAGLCEASLEDMRVHCPTADVCEGEGREGCALGAECEVGWAKEVACPAEICETPTCALGDVCEAPVEPVVACTSEGICGEPMDPAIMCSLDEGCEARPGLGGLAPDCELDGACQAQTDLPVCAEGEILRAGREGLRLRADDPGDVHAPARRPAARP
ncbi:MAG: hypothetical protein QM820_60340 [Minicystis sp.]